MITFLVSRCRILLSCLIILFSANLVHGNEVEKYLNDLKSADINIRVKAATELAKMHNISGVKIAVKDAEKKVRHAAILNLSINHPKGQARRDPEAVEIFIEGLNDKDENIRSTALGKLRDFSIEAYFQHLDMDTDICHHIAKILQDPSEYIRWQAIEMLENCRVEQIEIKQLNIANDKKESRKIREIAIRNLAKSKIKDIDIKLVSFLDNKSEYMEIKRAAVYSLGKLKSLRAVDKIIPYVYDKDQQMHYASAIALGEIGDPKAANALAEVLLYNNGKVDSFVLESLGKVSTPNVLPKLLKIKPLLTNSNLKIKFAEALGATGNEEAVIHLLELIKDKDSAVQSWASRNLEKFDSPSALKTIIGASQKEPGNSNLIFISTESKT